MSELTEYLRKNIFLVPMENGGELISNAPSTAADKIDELQTKVEKLTAELNNHDYKLGKTVKALQAKVENLTAALEYVAGPMMLGDEPTMGYHSQAIAYIEAELSQESE